MRGVVLLLVLAVLGAGCADGNAPAADPDPVRESTPSTSTTWQLQGAAELVYDGVVLPTDPRGCQAFALQVPPGAERLFVALSNQVPPAYPVPGAGFPRLRLMDPAGTVLADAEPGPLPPVGRMDGNLTVLAAASGTWHVHVVAEAPVVGRAVELFFFELVDGPTAPTAVALEGPQPC